MLCLTHTFFWSPHQRLQFLQDASDRFETMCRDPREPDLDSLEVSAYNVVGLDWHHRLDKIFINNLGKFRKYDGRSVQDLLRAMRNKVCIKLCSYKLNNVDGFFLETPVSGSPRKCQMSYWSSTRRLLKLFHSIISSSHFTCPLSHFRFNITIRIDVPYLFRTRRPVEIVDYQLLIYGSIQGWNVR